MRGSVVPGGTGGVGCPEPGGGGGDSSPESGGGGGGLPPLPPPPPPPLPGGGGNVIPGPFGSHVTSGGMGTHGGGSKMSAFVATAAAFARPL